MAAIHEKGTPLSEEAIARLRELIRTDGEPALMARFGVSRDALYRALAGLPLLKHTLDAVQAGVAGNSGNSESYEWPGQAKSKGRPSPV